jgi:hypothetical protein
MIGRLTAIVLGIVALGIQDAAERPEGYRQILPRGRIAAVDAPSYVPASEADIHPGSWVLGVVIDGQPRAYSLNLLNAHEVVNDTIGETSFAAVW